MLKPRRSAQNGSVLFLVIIFVFILSTVGMTVISLNGTEEIFARGEIDKVRAMYLAEAGIERARIWLENTGELPENMSFPGGGTPNGTEAFQPFGGGVILEPVPASSQGIYRVSIDPDDANPGREDKIYVVVSTGITGNYEKTIVSTITVSNRLRYAYFSDNEGADGPAKNMTDIFERTYFTSCDTFEGKVHSNDKISLCGAPLLQAKGDITAAEGFYYFCNYNALGLAAGNIVPRVDFFARWDLETLASIAQKESFYQTGDVTILLGRDGFRIGSNQYDIQGSTAVVYVIGNIILKDDPSQQAFRRLLTIVSSGTVSIQSNILCKAAGGGCWGSWRRTA